MLRRFVIATIAILGLLAVSAAPAGAATGRLTLQHNPGGNTVLTNPDPGCYNMLVSFTLVINATNKTVIAYAQPGCGTSPKVFVPARQQRAVPPSFSVSVFP